MHSVEKIKRFFSLVRATEVISRFEEHISLGVGRWRKSLTSISLSLSKLKILVRKFSQNEKIGQSDQISGRNIVIERPGGSDSLSSS